MKTWDARPVEIRNLFNPAYCGLIVHRALTGFEEEDERGMPFSLVFPVLPLCLHRDSREILEGSTRSYLLKVVSSNPQIQVGLADRATNLLPFLFEGLGLLMNMGCFAVTDDGRLKVVANRVRKSITGTPESIATQRVARFVGREFARIADRVTIYSSLGIRP
jgi:hypothetical protein